MPFQLLVGPSFAGRPVLFNPLSKLVARGNLLPH
jgi:hypothetical protein